MMHSNLSALLGVFANLTDPNLGRERFQSAASSRPEVDRALAVIHERCSDPRLTLASVARSSNVSELLSQHTGMSFRQHVRDLRMHRAADLLLTPRSPLSRESMAKSARSSGGAESGTSARNTCELRQSAMPEETPPPSSLKYKKRSACCCSSRAFSQSLHTSSWAARRGSPFRRL